MEALAGQYLYCVVQCSQERTFEDVPPIGGGQGPVHTVPWDSLAAVVSDSAAVEYQISRANMLAHQRVVERVLGEFTMLPVRFGTVARGASPSMQVQNLLKVRHQEFQGLLAEMEGMVELGLKALWREEKAVLEEIVKENVAIRRLRDAVEGRPAQATHFERMRLGEMVKGAMDQKRGREAQGILAPLRPLAARTVENQVLTDRMVANAAFLVNKGLDGSFDQAVANLDRELGHRMAFKYVGPVPPYNFVNITVTWQES